MSDGSDIPPGGPDDGRALVAEFVLGLLEPDEAAAVEARLRSDPELRAEYLLWTEHLADLAEAEVAPVQPPPRVLAGIRRRAYGAEEGRSWLSRLGILPAFLTAAVAAAVLWFALTFDLLRGSDPVPLFATVIETEAGGIEAAFLDDHRVAVAVPPAGLAPEGRVLELWLISGDAAPVSLGLLTGAEIATLPLPEEFNSPDGAVLAISEEPPGGSPTGAPTGAVLGTGVMAPV